MRSRFLNDLTAACRSLNLIVRTGKDIFRVNPGRFLSSACDRRANLRRELLCLPTDGGELKCGSTAMKTSQVLAGSVL